MNDLLGPFFPKAPEVRKEPYAGPASLPQHPIRVKKDYYHAICRALVSGSKGTDQLKPVVDSYKPKAPTKAKEDKHEVALLKLTKQLGAFIHKELVHRARTLWL